MDGQLLILMGFSQIRFLGLKGREFRTLDEVLALYGRMVLVWNQALLCILRQEHIRMAG